MKKKKDLNKKKLLCESRCSKQLNVKLSHCKIFFFAMVFCAAHALKKCYTSFVNCNNFNLHSFFFWKQIFFFWVFHSRSEFLHFRLHIFKSSVLHKFILVLFSFSFHEFLNVYALDEGNIYEFKLLKLLSFIQFKVITYFTKWLDINQTQKLFTS